MTSATDSYHALCAYTIEHARTDAAFIHQHVVDAQAAQTADEHTRPIGLTFALVGLYLHVERGLSGRQVQRVHMQLAKRKRAWPTIALPKERGTITATDVMAAEAGPPRDQAIEAWCVSVWTAYRDSQPAIEALLREYGV